jgi:DNA-binding NtrC family response regulator
MRLLVVGPNDGPLATAGQLAFQKGASVLYASDVSTALHMLRSGKGADLILTDIQMPVKSLLDQLKAERFVLPVIVGGIKSDPERVVEVIKMGAMEYISLPADPEIIATLLQNVTYEEDSFLVVNDKKAELIQLAKQIAPSKANVLITGESGTGKEVMARFIHRHSRCSSQQFISVNCAAIPENLLESELFGHEKGAFTGALARRIGKFEEASGGTLLLDEISEMHPRLQAKLLRAIQERQIDRLGGNNSVKVDIRLIATSNRDLWAEVQAGNFREDLYFRLNVIHLNMVPLRETPEDIEILAKYFIKKYALLNNYSEKPFALETLQYLKNLPWKGNIRELENTIHRALLIENGPMISKNTIDVPYLEVQEQLTAFSPSSSILVGQTVSTVERGLILDTLHYYHGNRTKAANVLGISIRTLRNKLKLYEDTLELGK